MKGLTEDQNDLLRDVVETDTWPAIIALCDLQIKNLGNRVLDLRADASELALEKARYEGAQALVKALANLKQDLKEKPNGRRRVVKAR